MHPKLILTGTLLALLATLALGPPVMAQTESDTDTSETPGDTTPDESEPPKDDGPAIPLTQDPDC